MSIKQNVKVFFKHILFWGLLLFYTIAAENNLMISTFTIYICKVTFGMSFSTRLSDKSVIET